MFQRIECARNLQLCFAIRAGNSAMMRRLSSLLICDQRAISSNVRPQPEQRPLPGS
jgi:hypothetical protein